MNILGWIVIACFVGLLIYDQYDRRRLNKEPDEWCERLYRDRRIEIETQLKNANYGINEKEKE